MNNMAYNPTQNDDGFINSKSASEQDIKANVQTQQTGEGEFVTTDTSGDYSLFAPKAITNFSSFFS